MSSAVEEIESTDGPSGSITRQCVWPPLPGADPDGYSEVDRAFESYVDGSESLYAVRLTTSCQRVELSVDYGIGGAHWAEEPIVVERGELRGYEVDVRGLDPSLRVSYLEPSSDQMVVVHRINFLIGNPRCVR